MLRLRPRTAQASVLAPLLLLPCVLRAFAQCGEVKLLPSLVQGNQGFGTALSGLPGIFVAGVPGNPLGDVSVFELDADGRWRESALLGAERPQVGDGLGGSVAVDGRTIVSGAYARDSHDYDTGAVFVFEYRNGTWRQTAELLANDGERGDGLGYSVAISGDTLVAGAPFENATGFRSGSVYVFQRLGGTWVQAAKLAASDGIRGANLGWSVALEGDILVAGARGADVGEMRWAGKSYIFERSSKGVWCEAAILNPSDARTNRSFGIAVSIRDKTALIGSTASTNEPGAGKAYVFERTPDGRWPLVVELTASDGGNSDVFGKAVTLRDDFAVIGAPGDSVNGVLSAGSAYVFWRAPDRRWREIAKLTASDPGRDDYYGEDVTIVGGRAVIGAWGNDDYGPNTGSVYLYPISPDLDHNGRMDICECPGDLNRDGTVDQSDLGMLLADYGCTRGVGNCPGDADGDGDTDQADLGILLGNWGQTCR